MTDTIISDGSGRPLHAVQVRDDEIGLNATIQTTRPMTILYGVNGVGKSRTLAALAKGRYLLRAPFSELISFWIPGSYESHVEQADSAYIQTLRDGRRISYGIVHPGPPTHDVRSFRSRSFLFRDKRRIEVLTYIFEFLRSKGDDRLEACLNEQVDPNEHLVTRLHEFHRAAVSLMILEWCVGLPFLQVDRVQQLLDSIDEVLNRGHVVVKHQSNSVDRFLDEQSSYPWISEHFVSFDEESPASRGLLFDIREFLKENHNISGPSSSFEDMLDSWMEETFSYDLAEECGSGYYLQNNHLSDSLDNPDIPLSLFTRRHKSLPLVIEIESEQDMVAATQMLLALVARKATLDQRRESLHAARTRYQNRFTEAEILMFDGAPGFELSELAKEASAEMSEIASIRYRELLPDAPRLELRPTKVSEWSRSNAVEWVAHLRPNLCVQIEQLSDTQLRWAKFAIGLTANEQLDRIHLLLIDEPERGLHRRAEVHLRNGLSAISANNPNLSIIATSHSPIFLDPRFADLIHAQKDSSGNIRLLPIKSPEDPGVDYLGLNKGDLLFLVRLILLVEGEHDLMVMNFLFGDEFARQGIRVLPIRGALKLGGAAEGTFLFEATDATIVAMLDNITEHPHSMKARLSEIRDRNIDDVEQAVRSVETLFSGKVSTEMSAIKEFIVRAITHDRLDRVDFVGLTKRDIQEYFDPIHFLCPGKGDELNVTEWEDLRELWMRAGGQRNFKSWLTENGIAEFGAAEFRRATDSVKGCIPQEFVDVVSMLTRMADLRR